MTIVAKDLGTTVQAGIVAWNNRDSTPLPLSSSSVSHHHHHQSSSPTLHWGHLNRTTATAYVSWASAWQLQKIIQEIVRTPATVLCDPRGGSDRDNQNKQKQPLCLVLQPIYRIWGHKRVFTWPRRTEEKWRAVPLTPCCPLECS